MKFKNTKKKRIINIIGKILMIMGSLGIMCCYPIIILLEIYIKIFYKDVSDTLNKWFDPSLIISLIIGMLGVIMFALTEDRIKKTPKTRADKYKIKSKDYDVLMKHLNTSIAECEYKLIKETKVKDNISMCIFAKRYFKTAEFITIIILNELKDGEMYEINEEHDKWYYQYVEDHYIVHAYDTYIVITTKENEVFLDYFNTPVSQHINTYSINLGISLDKKKLYITKPDCELGIAKYYKLRKKIIKAINFNELIKQDNN